MSNGMNHNQIILAASIMSTAALMGCQPHKPPLHRAVTQPNLNSPVMTDVNQRMPELKARAAVFTAAAKALPGDDSADDRKLTIGAFDSASAALALLGGPTPNGGFRQDLRIIDNVRQRISSSSPDMSIDPTTDTGLRAIYNALINLRERYFLADRQVQTQLDAVRDKVDALDSVRGPLHSVTAAECFVAESDLVNTMSAKLEGRAFAPTTAPAPTPTIGPTTESSTTQP